MSEQHEPPVTQTISEAMARIKTVQKRIATKREFIAGNVLRPEMVKDPLHGQGGSKAVIDNEWRSVNDMEQEIVRIRAAIANANVNNEVTIGTQTRTIADWLTWRRDVMPANRAFLGQVSKGISAQRSNMLRDGKGGRVLSDGSQAGMTDVIVNLDEVKLSKEIEDIEAIVSTLDGVLSHKNATILVTF